MATFIVRLWIPDRPGALGAVGSRIGAVSGDLVGIEILERGGGRAIDELVVELPDPDLVPLLIKEISQVDGVAVEDVLAATRDLVDARLDALETAAELVEKPTAQELLAALAQRSGAEFMTQWTCVLDLNGGAVVQSLGEVPPSEWLTAFVSGSQAAEEQGKGEGGPDDVAWAELPGAHLAVILGRRGRPFRARERRQLAALSRIVDQRLIDLRAG